MLRALEKSKLTTWQNGAFQWGFQEGRISMKLGAKRPWYFPPRKIQPDLE